MTTRQVLRFRFEATADYLKIIFHLQMGQLSSNQWTKSRLYLGGSMVESLAHHGQMLDLGYLMCLDHNWSSRYDSPRTYTRLFGALIHWF